MCIRLLARWILRHTILLQQLRSRQAKCRWRDIIPSSVCYLNTMLILDWSGREWWVDQCCQRYSEELFGRNGTYFLDFWCPAFPSHGLVIESVYYRISLVRVRPVRLLLFRALEGVIPRRYFVIPIDPRSRYLIPYDSWVLPGATYTTSFRTRWIS